MKSVSCGFVLNLTLAPSWVYMGPLSKIKSAHSPLNLRILSSTIVPFMYPDDGASAKFITNSQETDYSAVSCETYIIKFLHQQINYSLNTQSKKLVEFLFIYLFIRALSRYHPPLIQWLFIRKQGSMYSYPPQMYVSHFFYQKRDFLSY